MDEYLALSGQYLSAVMMIYDLARSAEKMMDRSCCGNDNSAWKDGPYLSSYKGADPINHQYPYVICTSIESRVAAGLVYGDKPKKETNGGVRIKIPPTGLSGSVVEPFLAKLVIIEQFEMFKKLMVKIKGPYNKKNIGIWSHILGNEQNNKLQEIVRRRNELTHEIVSNLPTMKEAVEFSFSVRNVASIVYANSSSV